MAESKSSTRRAKPAEPQAPSKRMVLRHRRVLALPTDATTEQIIAAHKALGGKGAPEEMAAWVECGVHEGRSKDDSIEAYAGKAGTADAKPGAYKAVPASSFAGGKRLKLPDKPLVESEAIE